MTSRMLLDALESDLEIPDTDPHFAQTGLRVSSTLRLHRLVTLQVSLISRELGILAPPLLARVDHRLRLLFSLA